MLKRIIVQADDLAYSIQTDQGVTRAYESGVATSTSVLANRINDQNKERYKNFINSLENKSGFQKPPIGMGVHLNVTFGKPLSKDWSGVFDRPFRGTGKPEEWQGSTWVKYFAQFSEEQVEQEYRQQIELALEVFGKIDHLSSHHHSASFEPLKTVYKKLAREYNIPVRQIVTLSEIPVYSGDFVVDEEANRELRQNGIKMADKNIFDMFFNENNPTKSFLSRLSEKTTEESAEVMFHPAFGEGAEEWRLRDLKTLTSNETLSYFRENEIELINYSQL